MATFFIALFVLVMQFLWKYIDDLAGKGLETSVIVELLLYASANLIPMAIPISVLLSSIMTFGNLAENNEILAFKTTGVSLLRIMKPLAFTVLLVSVGAFFFANRGVPVANLKFRSLLYSVKEQKPAMDIPDGVFYTGIEGFSIRVGHRDPETDELHDVIIYDKTEKRGNVMVTRANKGKMYITEDKRFLLFDLYEGARYHEMPEQRSKDGGLHFPHNRLTFEKYQIRFDLSSFNFKRAKEDLWKNSTQMLNTSQLAHYIDSTYILVNNKLDYVDEYVLPYFSFLGDSTFALEGHDLSGNQQGGHYISTLGDGGGRQLFQRAMSHARSVKGALKSAANELEYQTQRRISAKIELHRKFTLSIACLILFFVGAPLGAIIRKGGLGLPVVISIVLFVIYYIVMIGAEKSAKQQIISPEMGMWFPVFFIIPFAFLLTYRANSDSKLFNISGIQAALSRALRIHKGNRPK